MDRFESRLEIWAVDEISGSPGEVERYIVAVATKSIQVRPDGPLALVR